MTDLAAEGDRLHGTYKSSVYETARAEFRTWLVNNWPAIAAALRERDELAWELRGTKMDLAECAGKRDGLRESLDRLREWYNDASVRAETAEADADRLVDLVHWLKAAGITGPGEALVERAAQVLAAHVAAVEARP